MDVTMQPLLVFCFFVTLNAFPSGEYPIHPGVGAIYKGPNSETIIAGPDGSVITAAAIGATITVDAAKEVEVEAVPIVAAINPAPVITQVVSEPLEPIVVAELDEGVKETEIVAGNEVGANLEGPSGSISTHGSNSIIAGPASTTISDSKSTIEIVPAPVPIIAVQPLPIVQPFAPTTLIKTTNILQAPGVAAIPHTGQIFGLVAPPLLAPQLSYISPHYLAV